MTNAIDDFRIEYIFTPSPDSEERTDQAWDIIFALILDDHENEIQGFNDSKNMPC